MNDVEQLYEGKRSANSKRLFCLINCILLSLVMTNVKSDETSSRQRQHQVEISGFAFIPKLLKVSAGDTIMWINRDIVSHNIVDSANQVPISPDLAAGETYTFVVQTPMLYKCGLHPSMKGKLVLSDSP